MFDLFLAKKKHPISVKNACLYYGFVMHAFDSIYWCDNGDLAKLENLTEHVHSFANGKSTYVDNNSTMIYMSIL